MEFDVGVWYHIRLSNEHEYDIRYMHDKKTDLFYFLDCKGNKVPADKVIPNITKYFIAGNPCP